MDFKILVVDDEPIVREVFSRMLSNMGCYVETVDSGSDALGNMTKKKYNLIFLDLNMGGLSGVDTLRLMRQQDADVPVYIITSFFGEYFDELERATSEGLNFELCTKPVLVNQIKTLVDGIKFGSALQQEV